MGRHDSYDLCSWPSPPLWCQFTVGRLRGHSLFVTMCMMVSFYLFLDCRTALNYGLSARISDTWIGWINNNNILLRKLEFYGIRGLALQWFKNYLTGRKQYVLYNNTQSSKQYITCGVPQGSVLGPLLFLFYINDIPNCLKHSKSIVFADDTTIFASCNNMNTLYNNMNDDLANLINWFMLSLNITEVQQHKWQTLKEVFCKSFSLKMLYYVFKYQNVATNLNLRTLSIVYHKCNAHVYPLKYCWVGSCLIKWNMRLNFPRRPTGTIATRPHTVQQRDSFQRARDSSLFDGALIETNDWAIYDDAGRSVILVSCPFNWLKSILSCSSVEAEAAFCVRSSRKISGGHINRHHAHPYGDEVSVATCYYWWFADMELCA